MRAATYCRVSSDKQEREGTSLETQHEAILKHCRERGYEVAHEFSEVYSGLTLERPKLNELRALIRAEEVQVIVVHCLDRLSRSPIHGAILIEELDKHKVGLEAVTESIENSDLGKLISYIRGFAAKLETEKMKERCGRGKRAKVAQGELPQGTGVGPYGYTWNILTKRREVDEEEAIIVREIFHRVAIGEGLISVARRLNESGVRTASTRDDESKRKQWYSPTLMRIVRNSSYIGRTYFQGTLLPNVTPPIVAEDIFLAANAQLDNTRLRTGRPRHEYWLRGHGYCATCGKPLVGHVLGGRYRYYQCSRARPYENSGKKCRYIRADELESMVWAKTEAVLSNPELVLGQLAQASDAGNLEGIQAEIKALETNLSSYEQRRANLLQAMELGEFSHDEILDRLNRLKGLRREDEAKLSDLMKTRDNINGLTEARIRLGQLYEGIVDNLKDATPEIKRLAMDALDIKVYATTESVEIQGVIPLALPTTERSLA